MTVALLLDSARGASSPMGDSSAIAVIGMACRVPGASSPAELWTLLGKGLDAVGEMPEQRRALAGELSTIVTSGGGQSSREEILLARRGGWLEHIEMFDPGFFGISPREAAAMDPQQRLMLELCWEAFEDAAMPPAVHANEAAGVFVGAISGDYADLMRSQGGDAVTRHALTGSQRSMIANRVSYTLGLRGPSMTVDTGQSSSLAAVHLACESLRRGESKLALAGGVHLNISPSSALAALRFGALSPDGRCFTFDARANGYVRGEGGGVALLRPLSDALEAEDPIYAVIRSSALNNDGGGEGLTAPSLPAQEEVLRLAYRRSAIKRSAVRYVELHGSATKLGDRIEAGALGAVLGVTRPVDTLLAVGSVKTNIGHLEGAAGILGLIKTVLCIERGAIPSSLNFQAPPADVPLGELGLSVQQGLAPWPAGEEPLYAGVSSFGLGGTNCHVVLAEAPVRDGAVAERPEAPERQESSKGGPLGERVQAWMISARDDAALRHQADRVAKHVEENAEVGAAEVTRTLALGRQAFERRAIVLGETRDDLLEGLRALAAGKPEVNALEGVVTPEANRGVVFIFPGQGSQWGGMAAGLLRHSPVFAERIRACADALSEYIDWSLEDVLLGRPGAPSLERVDVVQPALFAVMVSLAELWRACGVHPAAVVGHSQGEVVAAHLAGGLSLEDAAYIITRRSHALGELAGKGGMLSIAAGERQLQTRIPGWDEGGLAIAAVNGPASIVVSGGSEAIEQLRSECEAQDIRARRIEAAVSAGHSPQVDILRAALLEDWSSVAPVASDAPFYSTVAAGPLSTTELGAEYWYRNLREPVRFEATVRRLLEDGYRTFVEVSPHPVLTAGLQETVERWCEEGQELEDPAAIAVVGTLSRDRGGPDAFTRSLAQAWARGVTVDWASVLGLADVESARLPTYPFQRRRHWFEHSPKSLSLQSGELDSAQPAEASSAQAPLPGRLDATPKAARRALALEAVCAQVALVTGEGSPGGIDASRAFKDLGFDSRAAVELRNRLRMLTGLRLAAGLLFDYPTPAALADHILRELSGTATEPPTAISSRSFDEPVAIVGMGCRFPGGVSSPEELWGLVSDGRDAISAFPRDRGWDLHRLADGGIDIDGEFVCEGGFLYDAGEFDAAFFGIGRREALSMDPQQRLLLEVCWEALEGSGLDPGSLRGSTTGVFAGISSQDYHHFSQGMPSGLEGFGMTGSSTSVVSGRVAYTFGLEGPAVTVDTACSSSLVSIHLACQSLRAGECSLALAGGVTVLSSPSVFLEFAHQGGLAGDGRCKPFSDSADGTGFSEGVGVVVLERLSDARRNGHRILAVVRGSAINQDGASNGLTAPNGPSQQRVIRQALASGGLSLSDVDAVEAHGTGTRLGDPIEAQALISTYGQDREEARPLWLGSVKSNIGHTQAAAGVAGLIKTILALRHGVLPRTLHVEQPSSQIEWSEGAVSLLSREQSWVPGDRPRRAAVSSFGISGTNAHLIIEEAPTTPETPGPESGVSPGAGHCEQLPEEECPRSVPLAWTVSARSDAGLRAQAQRLLDHLDLTPNLDDADVGLSLAARAVFEHRAVVLGGDRCELRGGLEGLVAGKSDGIVTAAASSPNQSKLAFMFTGQGAQRAGMGSEICDAFPVFADALDEVCAELDTRLEHPLKEVLWPKPNSQTTGLLDQTAYTQAGLFALEVASFHLLGGLGVRPDFLVGHSIGELAAAHVSGVLSLPDSCTLVLARGQLMQALPSGGAMVAIHASEEEVLPTLAGLEGRVALAAVNGPNSVVISGEQAAVLELGEAWEQEGRKTRRLSVSHAFHSPHIDGMLEEFGEVAARLSFQEPEIPIVSSLTGEAIGAELICAPDYWVRQARQTVRFADCVNWLRSHGVGTFLELGPDGVLSSMVEECLASASGEGGDSSAGASGDADGSGPYEGEASAAAAVPLLRRNRPEAQTSLGALARLWTRGFDVEWAETFEGNAPKYIGLPTYAFQRERFWLDSSRRDGSMGSVGQASADHPLLTPAVTLPGEGRLFTSRLSLREHPWLADHVVLGTTVLPGTAFLELALYACARVGCDSVRELVLRTPLVLAEGGDPQLQLRVGEADELGVRSVSIHSRVEGSTGSAEAGDTEWTCHAVGSLAGTAGEERPTRAPELEESWPPEGAESLLIDDAYERLSAGGMDYGPVFQGLVNAWQRGRETFVEVCLPKDESERAGSFALHPALLDAVLHILALDSLADEQRLESVPLPFSWSNVSLTSSGSSKLRARIAPAGQEDVSIVLLDEFGHLVASVGSLRTRRASSSDIGKGARSNHDCMLGVEWIDGSSFDAALTGVAVTLVSPGVEMSEALSLAGLSCGLFADLDALGASIDATEVAPEIVLLDVGGIAETADPGIKGSVGEIPDVVSRAVGRVLAVMQEWLADERFAACRLVLVTRGAVAIDVQDGVADLPGSAVWGLVRSAQLENPDRFVLIDIDGEEASWRYLDRVLTLDEPQLALRDGCVRLPRLADIHRSEALLSLPDAPDWRLDTERRGTLDGLALLPSPAAQTPLEAGQVRVQMRAAGLNFRDVLLALGIYPGNARIGGEGAGVVIEVGPGVSAPVVGERVMGLFDGAIGTVAVADSHLVVPIPKNWSFTQAASVPIAFLTAYYALVDLARVKPGERLLVHAAAGGVGMAAVQLAHHLGAEIFATASSGKWSALHALGIPPKRIASSRTLDFKDEFLRATDGQGMDVVLDCLAGEFVDASLDLLSEGGRFLEMGKADIREPDELAAERPGVSYRAFDLLEAGPRRLQEMLGELVGLFESGALELSPITTWGVQRSSQAFRRMSQGLHVGKNVLRLPGAFDLNGTVLIAGGTGGLGALVARHLVVKHGVRHLLLASRGGLAASGASELAQELSLLGAHVEIAACDISDREQVRDLLAAVPREHPLDAVLHAAGVTDDCLVDSLTPDRIDRVLASKVAGAWNLHDLTSQMDLSMFLLFSSIAGTLGNPGQANYSAANAFLDGLATHRNAIGLTATSMAWGPWSQASGMTGRLDEPDLARMRRAGLQTLSHGQGLRLFDMASRSNEAVMVPARLDLAALRAEAKIGELPSLFRGIIDVNSKQLDKAGSLTRLLARTPKERYPQVVLELVRAQTAQVLGRGATDRLDVQRSFKDLGFDSLAGVELRNRLKAETGIHLPATIVFDHPTPAAVARFLLDYIPSDGSCTTVEARLGEPGGGQSEIAVSPNEPIAIIGMSCRYPGGVRSPEELWDLVAGGRDAISDFPGDRGWDLEALHSFDPDNPASSWALRGGFLADAGDFDTEFFGIGPREALAMDPQQRLLLEVCWESIERAGIDPLSLRGTQTGVFAGISASAYGGRISGPSSAVDGYRLTGSVTSAASGRVAYTFGLEGPAVSIDTACSSSLVALHLACQALRQGECSMALAGGVMVMAAPDLFVEFGHQGGLARDGHCKAFSAEADGTGWSEGAGMLVLERLSDARRLGHPVAAVVRGSAVNQDGASNGLTAPNGPSQQRVIQRALASAGLQANEVDAVEAHGTGTRLGDPIEAQALIATYGQHPARERPLLIGSIKSNIGHAATAAGVAGVIKMVMALRHERLPKTLHIDEPSAEVDWLAGAVELLRAPTTWTANGRPRRAGVSSFGISGTNAHVILEEGPQPTPSVGGEISKTHEGRALEIVPWVISAKDEQSLCAQAARLKARIDADPDLDPVDIGFSLTSNRATFTSRAVVLGTDRARALDGLAALCEGSMSPFLIEGATREDAGSLAFMFTGQGSQRTGMGRDLYQAFGVFRDSVDETCGHMDVLLERSVRAVMFGELSGEEWSSSTGDRSDAGLLDETMFAQAALFAHEVAQFRLVESLGLCPDFLIGHSIGELVAAHVGGMISLEESCALVAARGRLMQALPSGGAMVSIQASEQEVLETLAGLEESIALAAVNGPSSVVISGDEDAVSDVAAIWELRGRGVKRLRVSHAFHSPHMDEMLEEFGQVVAGLSFVEPSIPVVSNLMGEAVTGGELCRPEYWVRHVRETVRFADGVRWLADRGVGSFLELGPDGVLSAMVEDCLTSTGVAAMALQRRKFAEVPTLLSGLAQAWVRGADLNWSALFVDSGAARVELPTYAFQGRRYWLAAGRRDGGDPALLGQTSTDHPLLGAAVALPNDGGSLFTGSLSLESHRWLADHAVMGMTLLPATAFLEMALYAGGQLGCASLEEIVLQAPLAVPEHGQVDIQVLVGELDRSGRRAFSVHSRSRVAGEDGLLDGVLTCNASGTLVSARQTPAIVDMSPHSGDQWPPVEAIALDIENLYAELLRRDFEYGPSFQCLQRAWRLGEDIFAEVSLAESESESTAGFGIHPALLDGALHASVLARPMEDPGTCPLPVSSSSVTLHTTGARSLRVRISPQAGGAISLHASDENGVIVAEIGLLTLRAATREQLHGSLEHDSLFCLDWRPIAIDDVARVPSRPWATIDRDNSLLAGEWRENGLGATHYASVDALVEAVLHGAAAPEVVLAGYPLDGTRNRREGSAEEMLTETHAMTLWALELLQRWFVEESLVDSRLVFITHEAQSVEERDRLDGIACAPIWGLARAAQAEYPERVVMVDLEDGACPWELLAGALDTGEAQIAIRGNRVLAPRLTRAPREAAAATDSRWPRMAEGGTSISSIDPDRTVLITGGTGGLGALLARHLVERHGARALLLTSRRGEQAGGAERLKSELTELGAQVSIVACDVCDREQVKELLRSIQPEKPLGALVHAAGTLDDGVIGALTPERMANVLRPKVDGAVHLHELTKQLDLTAFVLFSSAAATIGAPGQGNYAAANAFLDALAAWRRSQGYPALSLAWGLWEQRAGMAETLKDSDRARLLRTGVRALTDTEGLDLFDAALARNATHLLPVMLEMSALRANAASGVLSPVLSGLVRVPKRRPAGEQKLDLNDSLRGISEDERERIVLELVLTHTAAILGHASHEAVLPERTFKDLGFESLAAVELRNRLNAAAGLSLPATLVFDRPTPNALARYLLERVTDDGANESASVDAELLALERRLSTIASSESARASVTARLQALLASLNQGGGTIAEDEDVRSASADEVFELIDKELAHPHAGMRHVYLGEGDGRDV